MLPVRVNVLLGIVLFGIIGLSFSGLNASRISVFTVSTDTVNVCGNSTTLTTSTVPGYSNPIWNDGTTGTSLNVTSSGDYWWQVTGTSVVTNGDFSAATTNATTRGFTSSYTYKSSSSTCNSCCCGILSLEGTYTINTDPHNIHTNFTSMGDHTTGTGQMLIVNGSATANVTVWTQSINVQPNTDYVFSAWATSVNPQNPAQLQFSIDGVPLGSTINPTSVDGNWQYFTTTWNSGNHSGSLPIALVNQNIATSGNDFAVDDIVFAPVYRKNIHLVLNPIPVLSLTGPHSACGTYDLTKTIVGYDPGTYNYVFKDSNGNVISNVNAGAITQSGTYTITEQNKLTGCTSAPVQTTVTIIPNPQKPGISS
ncbi:hypothetical protein [Mucilaginibacter panaciglaebae]|uniref:CBM-cenC domain-containing protein n=1 Tax=Mucilaginibacter panaciglaebae TaxID=502331 RepID=A0ABP7X3E2_9SPHI